MGLTPDRYTDLVAVETERLADRCEGMDPTTAVPSCPEWTLADLLRHVGTVQRWAATMVERSSQERLRREDMDWETPEDPTQLLGWLRDGARFVESRFRGADPSTGMWAWGWPKTAGFWPRRMLHETGVHRVDAELALGVAEPRIDAEIAADGVDELLDNLPHAAYFRPAVADLRGDGETIGLRAGDTGDAWRVELAPDGFSWQRASDAPVTVVLAAPTASDLLLTLYGRRAVDPGDVDGDRPLLDRWLANSAL